MIPDNLFQKKELMKKLLFTFLFLLSLPLQAQMVDSSCLLTGEAARDSLGKTHLSGTKLTAYQQRAYKYISDFLVVKCIIPDKFPTDSAQAATRLFVTWVNGDTLHTKSDILVARVKADTNGSTVSDLSTIVLNIDDADALKTRFNSSQNQFELFDPTKSGTFTATFSFNGVRVARNIHIMDIGTPPPPPSQPATIAMTFVNETGNASDTIFVKPNQPHWVGIRLKVDSAGITLSDSTDVELTPATNAKLWWNAAARRYEVYDAVTAGSIQATATRGNVSISRNIIVGVVEEIPVPPVDTTTPPSDTTTPPPPTTPSDTGILGIINKIGPAASVSEAATLGFSQFDALWNKWEPTRWAADGATWGNNYYDRGLVYYVQYARTGDIKWKQRGDAIVLDYRRNYLHANNYQTSAHWAQLDGVALHYYLNNNNDSSKIALGKAAWNLAGTAVWARTAQWVDARQQARSLTAMLLAWQAGAPNAPSGGWAKALDDGINAILPQQSADGGWRYPVNTCDLALNYMNAMLADAFIRLYDSYRPDPRLYTAIKKTADYLWTQWRANDAIPSFNYYEAQCNNQHGNGGPFATQDLTGLFTTTYAWLAKHDQSYRPKADAVINNTLKGLYPQGSKQFNQAFTYTWRAIGYLSGN